MKKLITVILILSLLLPSAALAADPIVGTWYIYSGIVEDQEIREQAYYEFSTFHFSENGTVFSSTYDISEGGDTSCKDYHVLGMWTKEENDYYVNLGFNGAVKLYFDKDELFFPVSDYSLRLHKMVPVNYVLDIRN